MKRIVNIILTLCIVASMLAGVSLNAFAAEIIEEVTISGVPEELEEGQAWSDINISVPDDANYRIEREWAKYDADTDSFSGGLDSVTVDAGVYKLFVYLYPKDGAAFPASGYFDWDISDKDVDSWDCFEDEAYFTFIYSVGLDVIDEVEIISVKAPVVGEMSSLDAVVIPEDAPYSIDTSRSKWIIYEDGRDDFSGAFLDDATYRIDLYLVPDEGYVFNEDAETIFPMEEVYRDQTLTSVNYEFEFTTKDLITSVDISGVPDVELGNEFTLDNIVLSENVVLTSDSGLFKDGFDGAFEGIIDGGEYLLDLFLKPAEGYAFSPDVEITVNGKALTSGWNIDVIAEELNIYTNYDVNYPKIYEVHFGNVPEAELGGAAVIGGVTIPEDALYTIEYVQWCDKTSESCDITTFEDGHRYTYNIRFIPLPGYQFAETVDLYIDGELVGDDWTDEDYYDYIVEYSFLEKIDKVEIEGSLEAVIGEIPVVQDIKPVPADAKYEIVNAEWYNVTDDTYDIERFEDGKKYELYIEIVPVEGCEFTDNVVVILNGEETYSFGCDWNYVNVCVTTSFLKTIDKIEIEALPEGVIGQVVDTSVVKIPQGVHYSIDSIELIEEGSDHYDNIIDKPLEDKHSYELIINLVAEEGYEFSEDCVVYVGGEEYAYGYVDEDTAELYVEYSFLETIDKIVLPAFPEIEAGDMPGYVLPDDEDRNYDYVGAWTNETTGDSVTDAFENGEVYRFMYLVSPEDGYTITEETEILVEGEENPAIIIVGGNAFVLKTYGLGVELIEKIEITLPVPEDGKKPASIDEIVLPDDAKYYLADLTWIEGEAESFLKGQILSDAFKLGKYYFIMLAFEAEDGYYISPETELYINGEKADNDPVMSMVLKAMVHSFGELKEDVDPVEPTDPTEPGVPNPGTDDNSAVVIAVMVLLLGATLVVFRRKEER